LYAGRIVWNRQTFIKDPETGRQNPRDQWMTADAEHLRIIDAETWDRVRARREERGGPKSV
jgi:site-specific DNA recombinase